MKDKTAIAILGILLLALVWNLQIPSFILYGGIELKGAEQTNIKGTCYTLADERCVQQDVNLINLTEQNLLICPETYYQTDIDCRKAFDLIEIEKPKINCYYIDEDECKIESLELETCPSQYYLSLSGCEEDLETPIYHIRNLFTNKATLLTLGIGIIVLIIIILNAIAKKR